MHFQRNITRIQDQDDFSGVPTSGEVVFFDGQSFITADITGYQGSQGRQGNQGYQGFQGITGFQGLTGAGSQGDQGLIGL
jgi:hypothetical protein